MQRIVLDTNCLLQSLPAKSPYHGVWKSILRGDISLCVNTEILEEYAEIISSKTTTEIGRNVVEAIIHLSTTVFQNTYVHFGLIEADIDDNKFVDCAIAADAKCIVSNDAHFKVLDSTNEHEPIHVHVIHGSNESIFDLIIQDGELVDIYARERKGVDALSDKDRHTAEKFIRKYYRNIIEKWIKFFVLKQSIRSTSIKKKL